MAILTILNNWKLAVMAALSGVVMILWGMLKYESSKRKKAERDIKIYDKAKEIRTEQGKQVEIIVKQEQVKIKEELESNESKSKSDRIDSL